MLKHTRRRYIYEISCLTSVFNIQKEKKKKEKQTKKKTLKKTKHLKAATYKLPLLVHPLPPKALNIQSKHKK